MTSNKSGKITEEAWFKNLPISEQGVWRDIIRNLESMNHGMIYETPL